jgi:polysaccharide export outer membrane protein
MQALSMAAGTNPFADLDNISILRQGASGQERIPFDYKAVAKGKDLGQNIELKSGDVVVVP